MKITLNRVNENYHFELKTNVDIWNVDNRSEFGGDDLGASPMELVLGGGCSAIIWLGFQKKDRKLVLLKLLVEGERVQVGSETV
jgi:putative redox protein